MTPEKMLDALGPAWTVNSDGNPQTGRWTEGRYAHWRGVTIVLPSADEDETYPLHEVWVSGHEEGGEAVFPCKTADQAVAVATLLAAADAIADGGVAYDPFPFHHLDDGADLVYVRHTRQTFSVMTPEDAVAAAVVTLQSALMVLAERAASVTVEEAE